jgi:hypothetical protein
MQMAMCMRLQALLDPTSLPQNSWRRVVLEASTTCAILNLRSHDKLIHSTFDRSSISYRRLNQVVCPGNPVP